MTATVPDDHPLRAGIEATTKWLADHKTTANRFAILHGIDPSALSRVLRGTQQRMSVDMANKIERATKGDVPYHLWVGAEAADAT